MIRNVKSACDLHSNASMFGKYNFTILVLAVSAFLTSASSPFGRQPSASKPLRLTLTQADRFTSSHSHCSICVQAAAACKNAQLCLNHKLHGLKRYISDCEHIFSCTVPQNRKVVNKKKRREESNVVYQVMHIYAKANKYLHALCIHINFTGTHLRYICKCRVLLL